MKEKAKTTAKEKETKKPTVHPYGIYHSPDYKEGKKPPKKKEYT